jgi:hypothetical protein
MATEDSRPRKPKLPQPAKRPYDPRRPIVFMRGCRRSQGTYLADFSDPMLPEPFYREVLLPRHRKARQIDILGVIRAPPGKRSWMLVRTSDEYGYIARRPWLLSSVLANLPRSVVRIWRGRPGFGPLRWQRVSPAHADAFKEFVARASDLPVWERHPVTRRWMLADRAGRRTLALRSEPSIRTISPPKGAYDTKAGGPTVGRRPIARTQARRTSCDEKTG